MLKKTSKSIVFTLISVWTMTLVGCTLLTTDIVFSDYHPLSVFTAIVITSFITALIGAVVILVCAAFTALVKFLLDL